MSVRFGSEKKSSVVVSLRIIRSSSAASRCAPNTQQVILMRSDAKLEAHPVMYIAQGVQASFEQYTK